MTSGYHHACSRVDPDAAEQDRRLAVRLIRVAAVAARLDAIAALSPEGSTRAQVIPRLVAANVLVAEFGISKHRASRAAGVSRVMMVCPSFATTSDERYLAGLATATATATKIRRLAEAGRRAAVADRRRMIRDVLGRMAAKYGVSITEALGANHRNRKAVTARRTAIRELVAAGIPRRTIADELGFRPETVSRIATGWSLMLTAETDRRRNNGRRRKADEAVGAC